MTEPTVTWTGDNEREIQAFHEETEGVCWGFSVGATRRPRGRLWEVLAWLGERLPKRFGSFEWYPPDDPSILELLWFEPVEPPEFPEDLIVKMLGYQTTKLGLPAGLISGQDVLNTLEHLRPELTEWGQRACSSRLRHVRVSPGSRVTADGRVLSRGADS